MTSKMFILVGLAFLASFCMAGGIKLYDWLNHSKKITQRQCAIIGHTLIITFFISLIAVFSGFYVAVIPGFLSGMFLLFIFMGSLDI